MLVKGVSGVTSGYTASEIILEKYVDVKPDENLLINHQCL